MLRSTNDLDILLDPENLERFREVANEAGFKERLASNKKWLNRPYPKGQYSFERIDGAGVHIDAHVIVNSQRLDNALTDAIQSGCIPSGWCEGLFFPSPQERFHIAVIHAFRVGNWADGSVTKYIHDACIALKAVSPETLPALMKSGLRYTGGEDWHQQILHIIADLYLLGPEWIQEIQTSVPSLGKINRRKNSKGRWIDAKLVYFLQARVQVFQLSINAMRYNGLTLEGVLFVLTSPFLSLAKHLIRKISQAVSSAPPNPVSVIPPAPPLTRIKWRWP